MDICTLPTLVANQMWLMRKYLNIERRDAEFLTHFSDERLLPGLTHIYVSGDKPMHIRPDPSLDNQKSSPSLIRAPTEKCFGSPLSMNSTMMPSV